MMMTLLDIETGHNMLNEQSKTFILFHFIFDLILVAFSWVLATYIRFMILGSDFGNFVKFLRLTPITVIVSAYFLFRERYYSRQTLHSWHREFSRLLILNLKIQVFFILAGYNLQSDRISRLTLVLFFIICQISLILNRVIFRNHIMMKMIKGEMNHKLFVIGHGPHMDRFVEKVRNNPQTGMIISCWADSMGAAEEMKLNSCKYEEIDEYIEKLNPQSIVIGYSGSKISKQDKFVKSHYNQVTPIILIPQVNYALIGTTIEDFLGVPLLYINKPSENHLSLLLKRLIDVGGALFGLIVLSPLFLVVSLLVKLTSPGPIFYAQERMTANGRVFKMWKFRSMKQDADKEEGFTWTVENDPRRTKFGTFIRKTSLDEFPQLWNVLIGDMSLVGPRPERPELIEGFKDEITGYMLRHKMRAGITGWAQINGWRGNTSLEKRIEFDMYYIRNWSLPLDLKILLLTVFNGFVNKNAY
jgi:exopolysaccharide biosynthesis polyprenyl glycosylphosphotransferase